MKLEVKVQISQIIARLKSVYPDARQAQQVAYWLLEKLLSKPVSSLFLESNLRLTVSQSKQLDNWLASLVDEHKPLAYILGNIPFLDLEILVEPPVLIPRLETEWWVNLLRQRLDPLKNEELKILDLCSGSGCIGLALAKYFFKSHVTMIDISPQACNLITKNIFHNKLDNVTVVQSDLTDVLTDQKFDLIVANPPYIPLVAYEHLDLSVRLWEAQNALISTEADLYIITKIIDLSPRYLHKKYENMPQLWLEIDVTQGEAVQQLMQANFDQVELLVDQFGNQRVIVGKN